ncbi:ATPase [Pararhodobacter oceanensis]|uniref:ATPase n=1 Tax=Pararhodobacter oceanensis TaxID=2172121 RepID=A0A2T8HW98_9RHOB|nr:ATPase [Pararhodobacter oceanensis]PVH29716.1 ATPase [Pararhodobacter oceanensis]
MIYETAAEWTRAPQKSVLLFGMSGLGKTRTSSLLREGGWFHYSVDYRIGTRYMGEAIADNFKREAMKVPLLRELLLSDSVHITSNITFDNLAPLSAYLGKPGDPAKGGLPIEEYRRRQAEHREAEVAALLDTPRFIDRASDLYGYENFVCDTSGSIAEVVNPDYPVDPVLSVLSRHLLLVWIEGSEDHTAELIRRFDRAPKPMYYRPDFLLDAWQTYLNESGRMPSAVDPDAFVRWTYARALAHRQPRYAAMAAKWGLKVCATEMAKVNSPDDFNALIAEALNRRAEEAA